MNRPSEEAVHSARRRFRQPQFLSSPQTGAVVLLGRDVVAAGVSSTCVDGSEAVDSREQAFHFVDPHPGPAGSFPFGITPLANGGAGQGRGQTFLSAEDRPFRRKRAPSDIWRRGSRRRRDRLGPPGRLALLHRRRQYHHDLSNRVVFEPGLATTARAIKTAETRVIKLFVDAFLSSGGRRHLGRARPSAVTPGPTLGP